MLLKLAELAEWRRFQPKNYMTLGSQREKSDFSSTERANKKGTGALPKVMGQTHQSNYKVVFGRESRWARSQNFIMILVRGWHEKKN